MNDFKNYKPDDRQNASSHASSSASSSASPSASPSAGDINSTVELAKAVTKAMSGKSQGQLLNTIIAEAERGKRAGTLTNADLDNFYNALAPMVDGVKRKKLKEVISRLKSI